MDEGDDALDLGAPLEDGDGLLGGSDDGEGLRHGGRGKLEGGGGWETDGLTDEGGVERAGRVRREEGRSAGCGEEDGLCGHGGGEKRLHQLTPRSREKRPSLITGLSGRRTADKALPLTLSKPHLRPNQG